MAGFKTHITTSTVLGIGYGGVAAGIYGMRPATCVLAGGLCAVSGMLPDLDSDTGRPLQESITFAASVVPMMLIGHLQHAELSHESMILIGAGVYLLVRFGLAALLKKFTVHRGMFHSIPALLIATELTYLICDCGESWRRLLLAGGVALGFFSHLMLDEIWSIEWYRGRMRFKRSFGTAIKFWGQSPAANFLVYAQLAALSFCTYNEPTWLEHYGLHQHPAAEIATTAPERVEK